MHDLGVRMGGSRSAGVSGWDHQLLEDRDLRIGVCYF